MRKIIRKQMGEIKEDISKKDCFDPFGSYSGVPTDPDERPIQDADDL